MITPILFECAFIAVAWWATGPDRSWPTDRGEVVFGVFFFCMFSAIAMVCGAGAAWGLGALNATDEKMDAQPYKSVDLVSLRSADGVEGQIRGGLFLMTGYIGSQQYYFWYEQAGDALTPRQVEAGKGVYVYEEDRKDGHLDVFKWHAGVHFPALRLFTLGEDDSTGKTWHFHVPKGSVQRQFNLK